MSARRKRIWNLLLGILLAATLCFIWGNSALPRRESAQISRGLFTKLLPFIQTLGMDMIDEHALRKLAHFLEFAVLGCELAALFLLNCGRRARCFCVCVLCALAVAAADETIQLFSGRAAMIKDVWLDLAGALAGISILWLAAHLCGRGQKTDQI